jgi:hypothetical protein
MSAQIAAIVSAGPNRRQCNEVTGGKSATATAGAASTSAGRTPGQSINIFEGEGFTAEQVRGLIGQPIQRSGTVRVSGVGYTNRYFRIGDLPVICWRNCHGNQHRRGVRPSFQYGKPIDGA